MLRSRILFQGSHSILRRPANVGGIYPPENLQLAKPIASELGRQLIDAGFDLVLTGGRALDAIVGAAAAQACKDAGVDPRVRIRTYPHGQGTSDGCFGMILETSDRRPQEVRTFVVRESDAVVALLGGKGTSDCLQKAALAGKPVVPIAAAGGAARVEWDRLKQAGFHYREPGDFDFLADKSADASALVAMVCHQLQLLLNRHPRQYSRRVFVVHGHDGALKTETARFLERLDFQPVILHEQPDQGRPLLTKLRAELSDIGFAIVLLTPDDVAASISAPKVKRHRARQNVVFEHGMLVGLLGPERVCAIARGDIEFPSDLGGVLYKRLAPNDSLDSVAFELIKELKSAGYDVDANRL